MLNTTLLDAFKNYERSTCCFRSFRLSLSLSLSLSRIIKRIKFRIIKFSIYNSVRRSEFDSQRYQMFWEVVSQERGPLSFVSTTEELFGRKSSGSGLEKRDCGLKDPPCWPRDTLHSQKLALTSPKWGDCWVGILRQRSKATNCLLLYITVLFSDVRIYPVKIKSLVTPICLSAGNAELTSLHVTLRQKFAVILIISTFSLLNQPKSFALSQSCSVQSISFVSYFVNIHFNIILPSIKYPPCP
jgi:hypothetical protein